MSTVKDIITKGTRFVDVFFDRNIPENVSDFLYGAKPTKEHYEDRTISFTEYTPAGKQNHCITVSAEEQRRRSTQNRYNLVERFKRSKYADIDIVDAIVCSESERIAINAHFHICDLVGDYATTRIKHLGKDDYHQYAGTIEKIEKIVSVVKNGAILRVWYGHNARDLCGFMYLLNQLRGVNCTVIEIEAPEEIHRLNAHTMKKCRGWGEIRQDEICIPLSTAKILTDEKKDELLTCWDKLVCENSEYRIYENGELKSVDFEYLRTKAIPHFYKGKFSLSKLTGRLLKNEESFKEMCVLSSLPDFIYRLIDVGDLEFLGYRPSFWDNDCWLKSLH